MGPALILVGAGLALASLPLAALLIMGFYALGYLVGVAVLGAVLWAIFWGLNAAARAAIRWVPPTWPRPLRTLLEAATVFVLTSVLMMVGIVVLVLLIR